MRDSTAIVFTSDHGYHLGERDWWNKNTLFDRSCHAPLIIAGPHVTAGRVPELVEFTDMFPTIAEHCGVTAPDGLAGHSLWPQLKNATAPGRDSAWTIVTRGQNQRGDSICTDRWRLTQWSDGTIELYDHVSDPQETRNVATIHGDVVNQLSNLIDQRRAETTR